MRQHAATWHLNCEFGRMFGVVRAFGVWNWIIIGQKRADMPSSRDEMQVPSDETEQADALKSLDRHGLTDPAACIVFGPNAYNVDGLKPEDVANASQSAS
jgi:hypothetical protein